MPSKLITAPTEEPVLTQEGLDFLHQDDASEADLVESLIKACRRMVEQHTGRALMTQTWTGYFDDFIERDRRFKTGMNVAGTNVPLPYHSSARFAQQWPLLSHLELPKPPVQSVRSVKYLDPTGALQTLDPTVYLADLVTEPCHVYLAPGKVWPAYLGARNSIAIECVCGYESADLVPEEIKLAIKMLVANFYENREPVALVTGAQPKEMPISIANILAPYVVEWI